MGCVGWGGVMGAAGAAIGVPEAGPGLAASTGEVGAGIGRPEETGPQPQGGHMQ